MSAIPTQFLAKDGLYDESYTDQRAANIQHNEATLNARGFDNEAFHALQQQQQQKSPLQKAARQPRPAVDDALPSRASGRVRKLPPPPHADGGRHLDDEDDNRRIRKRPKSRVARSANNPLSGSSTLTEADQLLLLQLQNTNNSNSNSNSNISNSNEEDASTDCAVWLVAMRNYLRDEEHLTVRNYTSVLRQVKKLVSGVGISYKQWPANVFFAQGKTVSLADDFDALYEQACAFEETYGRDLGNGWLLRHPIKKLSHFQRYYSSNPDMILNQNILSKTDEHGGSLEVSSEKMFTHPVVSVKKERSKRSAAAAHDIDDAIASVPTATIPQYTPSPYLLEGTVTVPV